MPRTRSRVSTDSMTPKQASRSRSPAKKTAKSRAPGNSQFAGGPARIGHHVIHIGGFDTAATHLARHYAMPVLSDGTEAMYWAPDVLEHAVATRKIVGFIGEKGTGKTVAFDLAVPRHEEAERFKRLRDDRYEPERVAIVQCPEDASYRQIVVAIHLAALGGPPIERARGRVKCDDILIIETVDRLRDEHVAVVIMEEAELLTDDGLNAIRKISSVAEARAPKRYDAEGNKLAVGVGIVLVGTFDLDVAIGAWNEDGQRTGRVRYLGGIPAEGVPDFYRRVLPAFDAGALAMGKTAWSALVRREVTHGFAMPARFIETHVRGYVRRVADQHPEIHAAKDLPFDLAQFSFTVQELRRPAGCRRVGAKAETTVLDADPPGYDDKEGSVAEGPDEMTGAQDDEQPVSEDEAA